MGPDRLVALSEWMHCILRDDGRSNSAGVAGPRRRVPSFVPDMVFDEETELGHAEELLTSEDEASPEREVEPQSPSSANRRMALSGRQTQITAWDALMTHTNLC